MKTEDILNLARERFKRCMDIESENRDHALEDLRFLDGDQWPEDVARDREQDGRPCLVINKIPAYNRQISNEIRQMRPGIKVRGVDSAADPGTAEILRGMIRAIEKDSAASSAYEWAADYAVNMGWGYWRIVTEYASEDSFDQIIKIKRVRNPFSVYMGPTTEQDGSDCKYAFVVERMDRKDFEAKYPDAESEWNEWGKGDGDAWFNEDGVRVAEYWCVEEEKDFLYLIVNPMTGLQETVNALPEGFPAELISDTRTVTRKRIVQRIITGAEVLEENEWPGKYIPIVRVVGREMDIEGEVVLKGQTRDMKDPARQYNYMRSASVERIALAPLAPYTGPKGAFQNPKWRDANRRKYAYLEWDTDAVMEAGGQAPQRERPPDVSPGLVAELQTVAQEFKDVSGIQDAALGMPGNEVSGIAINNRRSEGDVSNYDFATNFGHALVFSGRILVDLIPKVYTGARMVRILQPNDQEATVQVNAPAIDPNTMRQYNFDLNVGRYDVVVDIGPSYATQRQEAAQSMLEMIRAYPDAAPVLGDLLAEKFDWADSDEVAKRLKLMLPPEVLAGENPRVKAALQQKDQQIQMMGQQLQQLQQAMQQMQMELLNRERDFAAKMAKIQNDRQGDIEKHTEGMTKLEIEASRDLGPSGVAYGT